MKRLFPILLFTLTLSVFSAKAQLAPVGTKWTYLNIDWSGPQPGVYFYSADRLYSIRDTVIDSTVYSYINCYNCTENGTYWTNENNKIYFYNRSKKCLFFDFNAKQNDTIYVDLYVVKQMSSFDTLIEKYPVKIDSIYFWHFSGSDSILSYAITGLQSIPKLAAWNRSQTINPKIIFGPDYNLGLGFYPGLFQPVPFESSTSFRCYEEPNGYTIKSSSNIDCATVGVNEINSYEKAITISPNPSLGTFQVEIKNIIKPLQLSIYDSKGDLVEQRNLSLQQNSNSFSVQLYAKQKTGMYYFVFELESGDRVLKKVVLQQ